VPFAATGAWGADATAAAHVRLGPDLLPAPTPGLAAVASYDGAAPAPARLGLEVHVGLPSRVEVVPLLPGGGIGAGSADAAALTHALAAALPAAALAAGLEGLRATVTAAGAVPASAFDGLLDALGLLPPGAPRRVRVPPALLADPVGWLRARPGGVLAAAPALLDAIRSLLDPAIPAGPAAAGALPVAPGVTLRARSDAGRLLLAADLDGAAFAGGAGPRLVPSGTVGLLLDASGDGPVRAAPDLSAELALAGRGALRLRVGPAPGRAVAARLELVPDAAPALVLVPAGPGLAASAVAGAAVPALKALLDAVAAGEPGGAPVTPRQAAGRVVSALGRALGLAVATPAVFDAAALRAFGADPAAALAARAPALPGSVLADVAAALDLLLGGAAGQRSATVDGGAVRVTVGPLAVAFDPGACRLTADAVVPGLPGAGRVDAHAAVSAAGLELLDVTVGPAALEVPGPGGAPAAVLRPFARVRTATTAAPTGVLVEIGLGVGTAHRFAGRFRPGSLEPLRVVATTSSPGGTAETDDPAEVALVVAAALLEIAGSTVLGLTPVQSALDRPVLGATARELFAGALLDAAAVRLDPALADDLLGAAADLDPVLRRLAALLRNVATASGAGIPVPGGPTFSVRADGDRLGLRIALDGPLPLSATDLSVTLCASGADDAVWPHAAPGVTLWLANAPAAGDVTLRPGVTVEDLGIRVSKTSGPLLDAAVRLDGVGLHLLGAVDDDGTGVAVRFGARVELAGLGVALSGAGGPTGGANPVASGLVRDAGGGGSPPRPAFSPALAVVREPDGRVQVGLTAGPGSGPWWLVIQKGFGPVYLEQVGLAVAVDQEQLRSVGIVLDASVSLLGLSAAVDDLSLTYLVTGGGSLVDPSQWAVDLAGFAVTADVAGLTLAGGLRKFPVTAGGSEYLGLLLARLAVYGLTVYGGYGLVGPPEARFASLFLFGALNGPIGGPPAFFVTGIGAGLGINRGLTVPNDLSHFGSFPFIKALDPAARPGDPMAELEAIRGYFPVQRGSFWFAAGLSFTSFALVDGVAVVAVLVGDGLEVSLLGLARMALPRPQLALVSVELGLVARFSTREGQLLVQAGLTDNSWLLYPEVRLTGGFAFATWFAGPNRGQFVLTLGGYHSGFHRDGYPVVPRLGLQFRWGFVVIRGGAFFALTSEAVMAGLEIEAHADLGPAWAHLRLGGEAIVFFDPFHLRADAWAEISAGITVDLWFGEVSFSVSLGATVTVEGPPFHARVSVHVGPAEVTVEIGDRPAAPPPALDWAAFVPKYLEEASPGVAHVLTVVPGAGLLVAAGSADSGAAPAPDGTEARPFRVQPEHTLTVTSTAPIARLAVGGGATDTLPTGGVVLGVAPMRRSDVRPRVSLALVRQGGGPPPTRHPTATAQRLGAFPYGVWGPPPDPDHPTVPRGDVIAAVDRVLLTAGVTIPPGGPDVLFRQVENKGRKPNPLLAAAGARGSLVTRTRTTAQLLDAVLAATRTGTPDSSGDRVVGTATAWVGRRRSVGDVTAWAADRSAPPRLGTLGEGLARSTPAAAPEPATPERPSAPAVRGPLVRAVLRGPAGADPGLAAVLERPAATTTVSAELLAGLGLDGEHGPRPLDAAPPTLAQVQEQLTPAVAARLLRVAPAAVQVERTLVPAGAPPTTRTGRAGVDALDVRGADPASAGRLRELGAALSAGRPVDGERTVRAGDLLVLDLPDSGRDDRERRPVLAVVAGGARVVVLDAGGAPVTDALVGAGASVEVPVGAARVVAAGLAGAPSGSDGAGDRLLGWHAAQALPYVGLGSALASGAVVHSAGRGARRGSDRLRAGHLAVADLVAGESAVTTTFAVPVAAVAVVVEGGGADDADLGIDGATLLRDRAGAPVPPLLVAAGARGAVVQAVVPTAAARPAVTVTTTARRRLVAVLALADSDSGSGVEPEVAARRLAATLAGVAPESLVGDPLPPGDGGPLLSWKDPDA
jgi:hypothetical protein